MKFSALMLTVLTMFSVAFTQTAFATVGSSVITKSSRTYEGGKKVRIIKIAWTANSADGTIPDATITGVHGYLMKVVVNPGAVAPTTLYDMQMFGADDPTADGLNQTLMNRSATLTEVLFPVGASGAAPLYVNPDTYTFNWTNNSVNSATGVVIMYFVDAL